MLANFLFAGSHLIGDNRILVRLDALRTDLPTADSVHYSRIHPAHRYLNAHVAGGDRVLVVGDAQVFDIEVPMFYNTCFDDCVLQQIVEGKNRDERLQALCDLRISHVYVNWSEIDRYRQPGNYGFTDYVTRELVRSELADTQKLLRLVPVHLVLQLPPSQFDPDQVRERFEVFEVRYGPDNEDTRHSPSVGSEFSRNEF
jgi:hypothetical protein